MRSESSVSSLTLKPMTKAEAGKLINRLMGSYPSHTAVDPEIYISALVSLFTGYPLWAGEKAIKKVAETSEFLPTIAKVKPILEDQVQALRSAARWEADAQAMQKRLAGPDFSEPAYRARMLERLQRLSSELRGASRSTDLNKKPEKTVSEIRDELVQQVGQAAFDAIPDAPTHWPTAAEAAEQFMRKARRKGTLTDKAHESYLQEIDKEAAREPMEDF